MPTERKQYQGLEHDQKFVRRLERNPNYDGIKDKRPYVDSALWLHCVRRYRDYWIGEGEPRRSPPTNYRDKDHDHDTGWFFPKSWVEEFATLPERPRGKSILRDPPRKLDSGGRFPSQEEIRRWKLPPGASVIASNATVEYADGSSETWGAIRRRIAGQGQDDQRAA